MPAVSVTHLVKSYGDKQAVRDVSFEVQKGEVFALLGPNGAGKTTTIEISRAFAIAPAARCPRWVSTRPIDPRNVGSAAASVSFFRNWRSSPFTGAAGTQRNAGYYPSPRPVDEVIEVIGLKEKADHRVKKLSGGQQRGSMSDWASSASPSCSSR